MSAESTSCGVGLGDAGPFVDALANPSPEVRLAVFDALTSLPLDRDAWFAVQPYAVAAVGDRSMPEHLDAIGLAARVPMRSVRVDLWRLAEAGEPEERRRAAFALARAHDVRAVGPLIMLLDDPGLATAASRHLALVDVSASGDLLSQQCVELPKDVGADWVRFWLALALARCGRDEALEPALERLKESNIEIGLRWGDESAWGDPDLLLQELRQGEPLPESTLERLRGDPDPGLLTDLLLRAAEPVVASGPAVADPGRVEPPSPAERARVKEAIDRSSIPSELADGRDTLPGTVERLLDGLDTGSDRATVLSLAVSEFFRRVDPASLGSGNFVVELITASGGGYVPDLEGLLEAYGPLGQAPDGGLRVQIAWASSRRGLGFLLRGLAHRLPEEAVGVARLVAEAAACERASEAPRFFAGPPDLPVPLPPGELIEDMVTANGGGGQHAEPPTRGLPPRREETPAARAEPPTRSLPRTGGPADPEPPAESRWVLAQVADLHDPARPQVIDRAFRSGAPHQVTVRIGPKEVGWIAPASGSSFDDVLGPVEGSQPLTVTFLAAAGATPQQAVVYLPPRGPSTACTFSFQPDPAFAAFEAQIHVFHRNRLVQLALLHGPVCADPADAPADARIGLELAAIVPGSAGLETRERFDAAVARTAARAGGGATAGVADDQLVVFDNDRIERSIPALSRTLKNLATSDAARRRDLADPGSVEQLRDLAFQGRELYDVIGQPIVDRLAASERGLERLQVLVESASDFFPVEFVYDLPPPQDDATLCPGWKTALRTGRCPEAHEPAGPRRLCPTVCPTGFWSVSKVIERQVLGDESWTNADLRGAEFAVRAAVSAGRNALAPPSVALFAASDRVDQVKAGQIAAVRKTLDRTAQSSGYVDTWDDWVLDVGRLSPTLLVLLSHTTETGSSLALEIGAEQRCRISQLLPEYVRTSTGQRPIVLLLGCQTAVSDFGLQTFVARFQDLGAALVVGTVASVLGQRAASVASAVATELTKASARHTPVRAGELLRDVRRRLLAKGELTALCLTAFGDADWQLGGD